MSISFINLNNSSTSGSVDISLLTPILGASAPYSTIGDAVDAIASKAPITSPVFSGIPTAPTAAYGTNTQQIATTSFVGDSVTSGTTFKTGEVVKTLSISHASRTEVIQLNATPLLSNKHTYNLTESVAFPVQIVVTTAAGSPGGYDGTFTITSANNSFASGVDATLSHSYKLYMTDSTTLVFEWVSGQEIYDGFWSNKLTMSVPEFGTVSHLTSKSYVDSAIDAIRAVEVPTNCLFKKTGAVTQNIIIPSPNTSSTTTDIGYLVLSGMRLDDIHLVLGNVSTSGAYSIPIQIRAQDANSSTLPGISTGTLIYTATLSSAGPVSLYNVKTVVSPNIDLTSYEGKLLTVNTGAFTAGGNTFTDCVVNLRLVQTW